MRLFLSLSLSLSLFLSLFLLLLHVKKNEKGRERGEKERKCELRSITRATIQDYLPSLHTIYIRALNFQTCNGHKRNLCQDFSLPPSVCLSLSLSYYFSVPLRGKERRERGREMNGGAKEKSGREIFLQKRNRMKKMIMILERTDCTEDVTKIDLPVSERK